MLTRSRLLSVVLVLVLAIAARAETLQFLKANSVDPAKLLPGPPSAKSCEVAAELDSLVAIQQQRTPAQVAVCTSQEALTIATFQSAMGERFRDGNLQPVGELLKKADKDAKYFSDIAKKTFHRPRPFLADPRIKPVFPNELGYAYPSGHAMRGILYATILAEIAPECREALLERGREIGWNRLVAGVHHPSDVMAGRVLGQALAQALLAEPKFRE